MNDQVDKMILTTQYDEHGRAWFVWVMEPKDYKGDAPNEVRQVATYERWSSWAMFSLFLLLLLPIGYARAETLAIICTDAAGTDSANCKSVKYDAPTATDLVRFGDTWPMALVAFSTLTSAQKIDTCQTLNIMRGTAFAGQLGSAADPCKNFGQVPVSTFATATGGATFTVSWSAPTQNVDDTPLTDLAGYWIWSAAHGSPLGKLTQVSATTTSRQFVNYGAGEYDFAISAYNTALSESALSNVVQKSVVVIKKTPKNPTSVK